MNRSGQVWQSALVMHPPVPPVPPTPADPPVPPVPAEPAVPPKPAEPPVPAIPPVPAVPPEPSVPPLPLEPPQPKRQPPAPPAPPEPAVPAVPPVPEEPPPLRGSFGSSPQPTATVSKRRPSTRQWAADDAWRRLVFLIGLMAAIPPDSWERPRPLGMRKPVAARSRRSSNSSHRPGHIPSVHPARAQGS